jgi:hypothetical protein
VIVDLCEKRAKGIRVTYHACYVHVGGIEENFWVALLIDRNSGEVWKWGIPNAVRFNRVLPSVLVKLPIYWANIRNSSDFLQRSFTRRFQRTEQRTAFWHGTDRNPLYTIDFECNVCRTNFTWNLRGRSMAWQQAPLVHRLRKTQTLVIAVCSLPRTVCVHHGSGIRISVFVCHRCVNDCNDTLWPFPSLGLMSICVSPHF